MRLSLDSSQDLEAKQNYLKTRVKPKQKENNDCLIIIDKGSSYGLPIKTDRSDFIWRHEGNGGQSGNKAQRLPISYKT